MFIALYHWRVKTGKEGNFQEGWHQRTLEIYRQCGSLGSRLHRADDGTWFAYAQWPDRETYDAINAIPPTENRSRKLFRESIEYAYPDVYLNVVDDLIEKLPFQKPNKA